jgi:hypothetical protein
MSITALMIAPAGSGLGGAITGTPSGTVYAPNAFGEVIAQQQDVTFLQSLGFVTSASGIPGGNTYGTNAATSGATLTAANIFGSADVTLDLTGSLGGAANLQMPTVAALIAAMPNPKTGQNYRLRIINTGAGYTWTVTTNTGWTLTGTMTLATTTWRDFIVSLTSLTAATLQNIGGGSIV